MSSLKYSEEFILDFNSLDRFIYRVSDVRTLDSYVTQEIMDRLAKCHIYLLCKRPRLSLVPGSLETLDDRVCFAVEYKIEGQRHQARVEITRAAFLPQELSFETSPYPHRELISRDATGRV